MCRLSSQVSSVWERERAAGAYESEWKLKKAAAACSAQHAWLPLCLQYVQYRLAAHSPKVCAHHFVPAVNNGSFVLGLLLLLLLFGSLLLLQGQEGRGNEPRRGGVNRVSKAGGDSGSTGDRGKRVSFMIRRSKSISSTTAIHRTSLLMFFLRSRSAMWNS